jgi:hypothetical protein
MRRYTLLMASSIAIFVAGDVRAANRASQEYVCIKGQVNSFTGETIACYTDRGCALATKMGGEAIRDYDAKSAPYALARGKIAAVITFSPALVRHVRNTGGTCTRS